MVLVAAGGLLSHNDPPRGTREPPDSPKLSHMTKVRLSLISTVLSGARGLKRRPLAPHPIPGSGGQLPVRSPVCQLRPFRTI